MTSSNGRTSSSAAVASSASGNGKATAATSTNGKLNGGAHVNGTGSKAPSNKGSNTTTKQNSAIVFTILSTVGTLLRTILIDIPLTSLFLLLVASVLIRHTYHAYVTTIIDSYRRGPELPGGFFPDFTYDMTYYNRQCDRHDITTRDASDLLVKPEYTGDQAADIMMKHGAVVVQNVLEPQTAADLRVYLESRHKIQDELPWHEKFFEEEDRLALGLGAGDAPVVTEALRQVGTHPTVKTTVEGILGPDPAIVEISTMTSLAGAEDQGIHTDSDYFGSSLLYSRTFLHSYTMFIALQNTTARMGATTLCPGTHHCANPDLEEVCLRNGAFEASSNGLTGPDRNDGNGGGVLLRGDAMMFNQNVWHRGAANQDPNNPTTNRVMFILTFVTRNKANEADRRYQGLGTYYYQRWNMWGHTYQDLKDSATIMQQPVAALRSMGIWKPRRRNWGITWIEHMARELGNSDHFYAPYELPDYVKFLDKVGVPKFLQGKYGRTKKKSDGGWQPFIEEMMDNVVQWLARINVFAVGTYLVLRFVALMLGYALSTMTGVVTPSSSTGRSAVSHQKRRGYVRSFLETTLPFIGSIALIGFFTGLYLREAGKSAMQIIWQWRQSGKLEEFVNETLEDAIDSLLWPVLAAVGVFLVARLMYVSMAGSSKGPLLPSFVARIVLSHGFVALLGLGAILYYDQGRLAISAKTKDIFERPFAPVVGPLKHDAPTTYPERADVLVGTRLDAVWLASFNDMFEYHPGNIRFNKMIASFATMPSSMTDIAVRSVFDLVQQRAEGVTPRFLLQSYADGYWMTMSRGDAQEVIRKDIAMERDGLKKALGKEVKSILADSRFGTLRNTALAKRFTPAFVKKWDELIFGSSPEKDAAVLTSGSKSKSTKLRIRPMAALPISQIGLLKKSAVQNRIRDAARSIVRDNSDAVVLTVGDKVLANYDNSGNWMEARIELIRDPDRCDVCYLNDECFMDVNPEALRPFESFTEGDDVEAQFEKYGGTWFKGTIVKVHPMGTYDVKYDDGDNELSLERGRIRKPKSLVKSASLHFDPSSLPSFEMGDVVMVNFEGAGEFYDAEIVGVNDNGTYDVEYTDGSGDRETGVDVSMISPNY